MQILSHRGFWKEPKEKNSIAAIDGSFREGFGLETDVRDLFVGGVSEIVVSHDPVTSFEGVLTCRSLVDIARKHTIDSKCWHNGTPDQSSLSDFIGEKRGLGLLPDLTRRMPIAINVKADGLAPQVAQLLSELDRAITPWFAFDMSGPEMRRYLDLGVPVFTRVSEFELTPILYEQAVGVWVDSFMEVPWYDAGALMTHLDRGKQVCLVSPELHGYSIEAVWAVWAILRDAGIAKDENFMLCTDYPVHADKFFFGTGK